MILHNTGINVCFLFTASEDQYGTFDALRPLYIDTATGNVTLGDGVLVVNESGGVTATSLSNQIYAVFAD